MRRTMLFMRALTPARRLSFIPYTWGLGLSIIDKSDVLEVGDGLAGDYRS